MRVTLFIILALIAYLAPFWLFLVFATCYAFWQHAYELLILGLFVDAQFGSGQLLTSYFYLLSTGLVVIVAELVKPHLSFYES